VGFCGLDRNRSPLRGDEVRACWEDGAIPATERPPDWLQEPIGDQIGGGAPIVSSEGPARSPVHRLWVEVEAGTGSPH
jgi:hypothetical protein